MGCRVGDLVVAQVAAVHAAAFLQGQPQRFGGAVVDGDGQRCTGHHVAGHIGLHHDVVVNARFLVSAQCKFESACAGIDFDKACIGRAHDQLGWLDHAGAIAVFVDADARTRLGHAIDDGQAQAGGVVAQRAGVVGGGVFQGHAQGRCGGAALGWCQRRWACGVHHHVQGR